MSGSDDGDDSPNFVTSDSGKLHTGTREDGADCTGQNAGNWAAVDADDAEEAVLTYNLDPCTRCIDNSYRLSKKRREEHGLYYGS